MRKSVILLIVCSVLIAGALLLLIPKPATAALLYIEHGSVDINKGQNWEPAKDESELSQGDRIRTTDGEATIVFYEGEIIHLPPNSSIRINTLNKDEVGITQLAGETWNKLTKISEVKKYTIDTPNTVATVRGTEFILTEKDVAVNDGSVDYWNKENPDSKKTIHKGKYATSKDMKEKTLTDYQKARFKKFKTKYIDTLKKIRYREIKKHRKLLKIAAKKGLTDINKSLDRVDKGEIQEDDLYNKIPSIFKPQAHRTYKLTKAIKRSMRQ